MAECWTAPTSPAGWSASTSLGVGLFHCVLDSDVEPLAAAATLVHLIEAGPQQALLWRLRDGLDDAALTDGAHEAVDLFLRAYAPQERAGGWT